MCGRPKAPSQSGIGAQGENLDGLRVNEHAADPFGGVKTNKRLVGVGVTQHTGTRSENTRLDTPMHVGTGGSITMFPEKHDQLFSREEAPITPRT